MIKMIVENAWWKFVIGLLAIFGFFGVRGHDLMAFLASSSWLLDAVTLSLLWGAFIFGVDSYRRSGKNRKEIAILTARLDGQFKKIDSQFDAVSEGFKSFEESNSDMLDLISKSQEDFNKRFEWLYSQILKAAKTTPNNRSNQTG